MEAALLLGGEGRRLKPLTDRLPKPLVPLGGEPLFHHTLRRVLPHVKRIHLLTAGDPLIWQEYAEGSPFREVLAISHEEERLGTGGGIRALLQRVRPPLVVVNGDLVLEGELTPFLEFSRNAASRGQVGVLLALHVPDRSPYGSLLLQGERVEGFQEKGVGGEGWIYGGIAVLFEGAEEYFPTKKVLSLEREVFPSMAEAGVLSAFRLRAPFSDAGTLRGLLKAQRIIMDSPLWPFKEFTSSRLKAFTPPLYISPQARVGRGCSVGPYVTVAGEVALEEGARVENSVILDGARVGRGAVVVGSALSPGTVVGEGEVVRGRIL